MFWAKTKSIATKAVTANFTTTNAGRFELINHPITGLSSRVRKNSMPTTVVKQSIEPIKISSRPETYFIANKKLAPLTEKGVKRILTSDLRQQTVALQGTAKNQQGLPVTHNSTLFVSHYECGLCFYMLTRLIRAQTKNRHLNWPVKSLTKSK
jgi:hypothetical protein